MKRIIFYLTIVILFGFVSCHKTRSFESSEAVAEPNLNKEVTEEAVGEFEYFEESLTEPQAAHNTEEYDEVSENNFKNALVDPLSTFSIDVDNASYSNIRRLINQGVKPEKGAVRIEEMINYFDYDYPNPMGDSPFSLNTEISSCPWQPEHYLLRIGLQGKKIDYDHVKPSNLVFLIDTSGSMDSPNKLPLLIKSFDLLINNLHPNSKISIVTYAGSSDVVLENVPVSEHNTISNALKNLQASGSTNGADGIQTAYEIANKHKIVGGNNRLILATDGDFNVGNTSRSGLLDLIKEQSKNNIYLTICGFGMGNYKDGTMEAISNQGNGNYFYIDSYNEANKVFKQELTANFFTIAKDVKIQVEFNPNTVQEYRLIGYENRLLNKEDFNDDAIDAGELGAGHNVTAIYQIVPQGKKSMSNGVDALKYQQKKLGNNTSDFATLKLRYKELDTDKSKLIKQTIHSNSVVRFNQASGNQQFASAVAAWGLLLRDSDFKGNANINNIIQWAKNGQGEDSERHRSEFINLVKKSEGLMR